MSISIEQIEDSISQLELTPHESYVFRFLLAYRVSKTTVTRLEKGDRNQAKIAGEILWKKKLYFKPEYNKDLHETIDQLKNCSKAKKHRPRFIVVTDFKLLLALDTDTNDSLQTEINKLSEHATFFLPLIGIEKQQIQNENLAGIRAAEKLGELYDRIIVDNPDGFDWCCPLKKWTHYPACLRDRYSLGDFIPRAL